MSRTKKLEGAHGNETPPDTALLIPHWVTPILTATDARGNKGLCLQVVVMSSEAVGMVVRSLGFTCESTDKFAVFTGVGEYFETFEIEGKAFCTCDPRIQEIKADYHFSCDRDLWPLVNDLYDRLEVGQ